MQCPPCEWHVVIGPTFLYMFSHDIVNNYSLDVHAYIQTISRKKLKRILLCKMSKSDKVSYIPMRVG